MYRADKAQKRYIQIEEHYNYEDSTISGNLIFARADPLFK